jgi:acyl transferase domain-containing protein/thioesterase domain-containing protein
MRCLTVRNGAGSLSSAEKETMKPSSIAIVGMAGRFPGARNIGQFWQNLRDGVESIRSLSDTELLAAGATAEEFSRTDYVRRASVLEDVGLFDATFFGLSPRDASIMDPQHRHFLECAWEALEDAAHPPQRFHGSIGVFAGSGMNSYLIHNLLANRKLVDVAGIFQLKQTGNDKDVLATRVSYQFDLRGPSINVQTACSTSLVAVHLACQSLANYECDMALAGGVTIEFPHGLGYIYREGEILSHDGHCRSFDASSSGTVFASGAGVVVLRRLEDAIADRDNIRAVILGSAINNDGARKVGFLAPSVEGQAEVIAEAIEFSGVSAEDISYVEAHGTGTVVGDPIEIRALTLAFRKSSGRNQYCGIGSLKSNVGHLDAAAGVAGLIKTVLALEHAQIPASLHFEKPNPHIEFANSPFIVNQQLRDWPSSRSPRRAGVTSLGIGGTNAHVVLEQAPPARLERAPKPYELIPVSAKTESALENASTNLFAYLDSHPESSLADASFTCQAGRQFFPHRRAFLIPVLVDHHQPEASGGHSAGNPQHVATGVANNSPAPVAFMFSGQGSQHVNMGLELYQHEQVFRESLDHCADHLSGSLGLDFRQVLYPSGSTGDGGPEKLNETWLTQPVLFAIEYSLACWWMSLGVTPAAMVGHSLGEYVAACIAGVFTVEDALDIVAYRGRLMYGLPAGAMLAVSLPSNAITLSDALSLAAVNSPEQCVVSGPDFDITAMEEHHAKQSVACRRLITSHAFHSSMMDTILAAFEDRMSKATLQAPRIPYLSNVTGDWIRAEDATDPAYWARHLRHTVHFSDCVAELLRTPDQILLEIGPGNALSSLAREQSGASRRVFASMPHPRESTGALRVALQTLGQLWVLGAEVDFSNLHPPESVRRIPLPSYPFEHRRFWIEPDARPQSAAPAPGPLAIAQDPNALHLYNRVWTQESPTPSPLLPDDTWLIFNDSLDIGNQISSLLRLQQQKVILVAASSSYRQFSATNYALRPSVRADYDALLADILKNGDSPHRIIHLWSLISEGDSHALAEVESRSFLSSLFLAQALTIQDLTGIDITFISDQMQQVSDEPVRNPAQALLLGPVKVIPQELPGISCRSIDLNLANDDQQACARQIVDEMSVIALNTTIAFRRGQRFVESLEPMSLKSCAQDQRLQPGGVYLITGGLGGIGLVVAEQLAREFKARLLLVSRSAFPPEAEWEAMASDPLLSEEKRTLLRKLFEIRKAAGGLHIAQADVASLEQMRGVVSLANLHFGKIDGVFHAAGVLDDGPLMLKTAERAAGVLEAKVRGTLTLEVALRDTPLRCFVLFSSISSIAPPPGQVDYAAANAFLDAFARSRKGPVTVINWGAWRDVGMAARSTPFHPFLERVLSDTPRAIVYVSQFAPFRQWTLAEHTLNRAQGSKSLLPGTAYLEMAAAALSRRSGRGPVELRDVYFLIPLMLSPNETRDVRIQLKPEQENAQNSDGFRFAVFSRINAWVEHATGTIAHCTAPEPAKISRAAIAARLKDGAIVFDAEHRTRQERHLVFGSRWRSLKRILVGRHEGLAEVQLDERFSADLSSFAMHPALLDLATGASLYVTAEYDQSDDLFLPISYRRIRAYRPLPAHFFSHIRNQKTDGARREVETFDLTLFDEHDQVLAEIEGFNMRRIANFERMLQDHAPVVDSDGVAGEEFIEVHADRGIAPLDGARALTTILMSKTPRAVVAVSEPIEKAPATPPRPVAASPKPVESAENRDIEATLASWWQEMLGVDKVGLNEDFFALGGHSLVGVRLFSKIRKTYQVDLEIVVLFEARTISRLAAVIRSARQPAAPKLKARSSLVAVQPTGSHAPVFCVHAIGGDVVFYEPLSKALGDDQPFYAFRSPHLAKQEIRKTTVEELAAAYVHDLREFSPQGPYRIGGASFGGIVAFEMARQLSAQGAEPVLLFLFDTAAPGSTQRVSSTEKIHGFRQRLRERGIPYLMRKIVLKGDHWRKQLLKRFKDAECFCFRIIRRELSPDLRYYLAERAHWNAARSYTAQKYPGKVTLLRAVERGYLGMELLGTREAPGLGWGGLAAGGLEIHEVSGEHANMLDEPHVRTVAAELKKILQRTETRPAAQL